MHAACVEYFFITLRGETKKGDIKGINVSDSPYSGDSSPKCDREKQVQRAK
jgi:hypothetical protein